PLSVILLRPPTPLLYPPSYTTLFRSLHFAREHAALDRRPDRYHLVGVHAFVRLLAEEALYDLLDLRHPGLAADQNHFVDVRGLRSEEHTSELQSRVDIVCRLLLEKKR